MRQQSVGLPTNACDGPSPARRPVIHQAPDRPAERCTDHYTGHEYAVHSCTVPIDQRTSIPNRHDRAQVRAERTAATEEKSISDLVQNRLVLE